MKKPSPKARGKVLRPKPFENNKVDFSKFKTHPPASDIAKLALAAGKVLPVQPIEVLSPVKTIGRGRTNLTLSECTFTTDMPHGATPNRLVIVLGIVGLSVLPNAAPAISITQDVADFTANPGVTTNLTPASSSLWSIQTVSVDGLYRSPFENFSTSQGPGYGNQYASIQQGGSALYNFTNPQNALSLLWGSPDSQNQIAFFSGIGGTGSNLYNLMGGALSIQTYGHDQVKAALGDQSFLSILLTSGTNSFEFANLETSNVAATPLPPAVLLFATGLGLIGLLTARRTKHLHAAHRTELA